MTPQRKTAQNQRVKRTMSKLCKGSNTTRAQIQSDPAKIPSLCEFLRTLTGKQTRCSGPCVRQANGTWPILGFDDVSPRHQNSASGQSRAAIRRGQGLSCGLWVPTLQAHPADGDVLAREYSERRGLSWAYGRHSRGIVRRHGVRTSAGGSTSRAICSTSSQRLARRVCL